MEEEAVNQEQPEEKKGKMTGTEVHEKSRVQDG